MHGTSLAVVTAALATANPEDQVITTQELFTLVAAAFVIGACGGSSNGPSTPSPAASTPTTATTPVITIVGENGSKSFTPNPASFGGQQVVFKNTDSVVHRVMLNDGSVDTDDIAPGATSKVVQVPSSGTNYHCPLHPTMVGAVDAASGAPAPECTGAYC
ncbi:MAG: hypothetical protein EXQ48_06110 [Acidobacteria bacterium]|nr:hypothetical protein [Acidobacteriota bacterium]